MTETAGKKGLPCRHAPPLFPYSCPIAATPAKVSPRGTPLSFGLAGLEVEIHAGGNIVTQASAVKSPIQITYSSRARGPGGFYCPGKKFAFKATPGRDYETEIVMTGGACLYVMTELAEQGRIPVTDSFRAITDEDCTKSARQ